MTSFKLFFVNALSVVVLSLILTQSVQSHVVDWSQTSSSSNQIEQPELQKQLTHRDFNASDSNSNSTANSNRVQLAGTLELFVHEFEDGSRAAIEYCVLIPFDGSDPIVIDLYDVYAECRDGLMGVFNVTPQENMFFDKQGCDPFADLLSCVDASTISLMEAEIVTLQGDDELNFNIDQTTETQLEEAATPDQVCYYFVELCGHCRHLPNEICNDFSDLCSKCKF